MPKTRTKRISKKDSRRIEKAIHFLTEKYRKSGFNEKPMVLHSMEVAFFLLEAGASADVVIIAILHDLIEDSGVSFEDIEEAFGLKIAQGVLSLTEDKKIKKYEKRYKEAFERALREGEEIILVRLADLYHNSFYIGLEKDIKKQKLVLGKIRYFLDLGPVKGIRHKDIYDMLEERYGEEMDGYKKSLKRLKKELD